MFKQNLTKYTAKKGKCMNYCYYLHWLIQSGQICALISGTAVCENCEQWNFHKYALDVQRLLLPL